MRPFRLLVMIVFAVAGIATAAQSRQVRAEAFSPAGYYLLRMDLFAATPLAAGERTVPGPAGA